MSKSWLDYLPSCTRFGSRSVSAVASLQNQFFDVGSVRLWVYTCDGKLSIPIVFVHWHISIFSRKSEALDWSIACYLYVTSIIFVCMQTLISRTCSCFKARLLFFVSASIYLICARRNVQNHYCLICVIDRSDQRILDQLMVMISHKFLIFNSH